MKVFLRTEIGRTPRPHNTALVYVASDSVVVDDNPKQSLTCVRPWNRMGSEPGPRQKAKVHTASPVRSSKPSSILFRPSWPKRSRKVLLEFHQFHVGKGQNEMAMETRDASHVWPRKTLESVEFQRSVFSQGRAIDLSRFLSVGHSLPTLPRKHTASAARLAFSLAISSMVP